MTSTQRFKGALLLAMGLTVGLAFQSGAQAQSSQPEISPKQRATFNKMVRERNRLYLKLQQLDDRAAKAMKEGKEPRDLHAEQISVQDELDLKRLRVEILATRYGLRIPPLPDKPSQNGGAGGGSGGQDAEAQSTAKQVAQAFSRGRNRALDRVRSDYKRFLTSLNFEGFIRGAN